jgi:hypothetical protein
VLRDEQQKNEEMKQELEETKYGLEDLTEQKSGLEQEKEALKNEILKLQEDLKNKETLNKGLVEKLVEESNAHKETILQHQVSPPLPPAPLVGLTCHGRGMKKLDSLLFLNMNTKIHRQDQTSF